MRFILVLVAFIVACLATPECRYLCDDPVWQAICEPVCLDPVCEYTTPCGEHATPNMKIMCPSDMLALESCPQCEVVTGDDDTAECSAYIECEAIQCSWECHNPGSPRVLQCQEQCELPACALSNSVRRRSVF